MCLEEGLQVPLPSILHDNVYVSDIFDLLDESHDMVRDDFSHQISFTRDSFECVFLDDLQFVVCLDCHDLPCRELSSEPHCAKCALSQHFPLQHVVCHSVTVRSLGSLDQTNPTEEK